MIATLFDYFTSGLVLLIIVGGGIAAAVSTRVRGAIVLFIVVALGVKFLFFSEKPVTEAHQSPSSSPNVGSTAATVPLTLQNYRYKGDNVKLECSGPTGNITCKPAQ